MTGNCGKRTAHLPRHRRRVYPIPDDGTRRLSIRTTRARYFSAVVDFPKCGVALSISFTRIEHYFYAACVYFWRAEIPDIAQCIESGTGRRRFFGFIHPRRSIAAARRTTRRVARREAPELRTRAPHFSQPLSILWCINSRATSYRRPAGEGRPRERERERECEKSLGVSVRVENYFLSDRPWLRATMPRRPDAAMHRARQYRRFCRTDFHVSLGLGRIFPPKNAKLEESIREQFDNRISKYILFEMMK